MTNEDELITWFDPGNGNQVTMDYILSKIYANKNYTVHVGTDSHRVKNSNRLHTFATVICLYETGKGADYYFRRVTRDAKYDNLRQRIMEEVTYSIDVSLELMKFISNKRIVVHADINSDPKHKTFKFLNQISSWVSSVGFKFHCKPDAWASTGVADKHTKY